MTQNGTPCFCVNTKLWFWCCHLTPSTLNLTCHCSQCVCCECYAPDDDQNILNRQHRGYGIIGNTTEPRIESIQSHWYAFSSIVFSSWRLQTDRQRTDYRSICYHLTSSIFNEHSIAYVGFSTHEDKYETRKLRIDKIWCCIQRSWNNISQMYSTVHIQMRESNNMYECSKYACKHEYTM